MFHRLSANTLTEHMHEAALVMIYKATLFTSQTVWYLIQDETIVTDAIHAISHFSQVGDKNFIDFNWIFVFPSGYLIFVLLLGDFSICM